MNILEQLEIVIQEKNRKREKKVRRNFSGIRILVGSLED